MKKLLLVLSTLLMLINICHAVDTSPHYHGDGSGLTNLNPANMAGVVTNGEASVTLSGAFSGNGSGLTNLNEASVTSSNSSVSVARTTSVNGTTNYDLSVSGGSTPTNLTSNPATFTNVSISGTFTGNGGGLTNLNPVSAQGGNTFLTNHEAASTSFGGSVNWGGGSENNSALQTDGSISLPNSEFFIDGSAYLLALTNFGTETIDGNCITALTNTSGQFVATSRSIDGPGFTGNGSGLTNLNAANLASGTVPLTQLPTNLATVSSNIYNGNGAGLTNTPPAQANFVVTNRVPVRYPVVNDIGTIYDRALFFEGATNTTNFVATNIPAGTVVTFYNESNGVARMTNSTTYFIVQGWGTNHFVDLQPQGQLSNQQTFISDGTNLLR